MERPSFEFQWYVVRLPKKDPYGPEEWRVTRDDALSTREYMEEYVKFHQQREDHRFTDFKTPGYEMHMRWFCVHQDLCDAYVEVSLKHPIEGDTDIYMKERPRLPGLVSVMNLHTHVVSGREPSHMIVSSSYTTPARSKSSHKDNSKTVAKSMPDSDAKLATKSTVKQSSNSVAKIASNSTVESNPIAAAYEPETKTTAKFKSVGPTPKKTPKQNVEGSRPTIDQQNNSNLLQMNDFNSINFQPYVILNYDLLRADEQSKRNNPNVLNKNIRKKTCSLNGDKELLTVIAEKEIDMPIERQEYVRKKRKYVRRPAGAPDPKEAMKKGSVSSEHSYVAMKRKYNKRKKKPEDSDSDPESKQGDGKRRRKRKRLKNIENASAEPSKVAIRKYTGRKRPNNILEMKFPRPSDTPPTDQSDKLPRSNLRPKITPPDNKSCFAIPPGMVPANYQPFVVLDPLTPTLQMGKTSNVINISELQKTKYTANIPTSPIVMPPPTMPFYGSGGTLTPILNVKSVSDLNQMANSNNRPTPDVAASVKSSIPDNFLFVPKSEFPDEDYPDTEETHDPLELPKFETERDYQLAKVEGIFKIITRTLKTAPLAKVKRFVDLLQNSLSQQNLIKYLDNSSEDDQTRSVSDESHRVKVKCVYKKDGDQKNAKAPEKENRKNLPIIKVREKQLSPETQKPTSNKPQKPLPKLAPKKNNIVVTINKKGKQANKPHRNVSKSTKDDLSFCTISGGGDMDYGRHVNMSSSEDIEKFIQEHTLMLKPSDFQSLNHEEVAEIALRHL